MSINALSVKVIADVLSTVAVIPRPAPRAPIASVLSCGWSERICTRCVLVTLVDVRESFSRDCMLSSNGGCFTGVKDKSRRRRLGQSLRNSLMTLSVTAVCRNFKFFMLSRRKSGLFGRSSSVHSLETVASVCCVGQDASAIHVHLRVVNMDPVGYPSKFEDLQGSAGLQQRSQRHWCYRGKIEVQVRELVAAICCSCGSLRSNFRTTPAQITQSLREEKMA